MLKFKLFFEVSDFFVTYANQITVVKLYKLRYRPEKPFKIKGINTKLTV